MRVQSWCGSGNVVVGLEGLELHVSSATNVDSVALVNQVAESVNTQVPESAMRHSKYATPFGQDRGQRCVSLWLSKA